MASYFSDEECRQVGFSPPMIETLRKIAQFVDLVTQANTTDADLTTTTALLLVTEARVDDLEAFENAGPYVKQDVGPAWVDASGTLSRATFATYAGQTVSNPPTQAEVQAIDDYVKSLSQRVAALVNDLRGNGALT